MRLWKVALLVNLAVLLGVGWGWAWWGRRAERLERELAQARMEQAAVEREWRVRGIVRAVVPEMSMVVISHEEIAGYMPAMTMGFRAASPDIYRAVEVGDGVRFTLRGAPPNVMLTAIERVP
jgi:Cu/Ag efflux protein CusF